MVKLYTDRRLTFAISALLHILILFLFSFFTIGPTQNNALEYVTIDFGSPGSGKMGENKSTERENEYLEEQEKVVKEDLPTKVEPPKVINEFDETLQKNNKENEIKKKSERLKETKSENKSVSKNQVGDLPFGSSGYSFDWGGRGTRKILRWEKPKFPPGVQKEVDIKIKFTILPDGSVVSPVPLIKADTQLEDAAIQALKTWKFEPLRDNQIQFEQTVIITIPYRLE